MAHLAGLCESASHVTWIGGVLVIGQVAGNATRIRQVVVVVDVAVGALPRRHRVQASQRESCRLVVKLSVGPLHGIVALLAGRGEATVRYRCGGVIVVRLMAADAGRAGDVVVIVDMAIAALPRRNTVRPGQRES